MTWIIFTILLVITFFTGLGIWTYGRAKTAAFERGELGGTRPLLDSAGLATMALAVVLFLLITGFMMVKTVGEREVGIVYNFTGTIAGKRDKGWVTIAPWQHMEKENIAIQHKEFIFGPENSAVSKDQQDIFANLAINYSIDSANVLDLYRRVGPSW